jgi:hypothetical protein
VIISLNSINQSVFIMEMSCVLFEVGTEFLNFVCMIWTKWVQTVVPCFTVFVQDVIIVVLGHFPSK